MVSTQADAAAGGGSRMPVILERLSKTIFAG
jgi:hypothetical protein